MNKATTTRRPPETSFTHTCSPHSDAAEPLTTSADDDVERMWQHSTAHARTTLASSPRRRRRRRHPAKLSPLSPDRRRHGGGERWWSLPFRFNPTNQAISRVSQCPSVYRTCHTRRRRRRAVRRSAARTVTTHTRAVSS